MRCCSVPNAVTRAASCAGELHNRYAVGTRRPSIETGKTLAAPTPGASAPRAFTDARQAVVSPRRPDLPTGLRPRSFASCLVLAVFNADAQERLWRRPDRAVYRHAQGLAVTKISPARAPSAGLVAHGDLRQPCPGPASRLQRVSLSCLNLDGRQWWRTPKMGGPSGDDCHDPVHRHFCC